MPNAPRIFKRLSELLDVTGQTGVVYVTSGTASFITTTGSGNVVRSTSPTFSGTTVMDGLTADNATIDLLHVTGASTLDGPVGMADALTVLGSGIYLGHASDTLLARVSPGVASIAGSTILVAGGALGTPASGTVTNLTGTASININGTVGATTPASGSFTTLAASGTITGTSNSLSALTVGANGATNPVLKVNANTASVATGLHITGAAAAGGLALAVISSGTNENLTIDAKGSGTITLGSNSTGGITLTRATTASGGLITTLASGGNHLAFRTSDAPSTDKWINYVSGTSLAWYAASQDRLTLGAGGQLGVLGTLAVTGTVTEGGSAAGAVTTQTRLVKAVASIADNTATTVLTITIPNAAHSASVRVRLIGAAGLGGAINLAREATATIAYDIAVTRTAGSLAVATISSAFGNASATVSGGSVLTVAGTITHGGEGTGVANTYLVKVTIDDTTGSATNHTCQVVAECANAAATGITIA